MALYISPPPHNSPLSVDSSLNFSKNHISQVDSRPIDSPTQEHFPKQGMDMLYLAENQHFWHRARREFIYKQVSNALSRVYEGNSKQVHIFDVGAGTGSITRYFLQQGFSDIAVGEMHPQGLEYAKTYGISKLYCMDLLDAPFEDEFDCIFAFDVIEHIQDDRGAILNMKKMLKNNQKSLLCLSVPAHQWLWNAHDEIVHHKRRYTKKELVELLQECGLSIESAQYFFVALTPLLLARALLNPSLKAKTMPKAELRDVPPPKILNYLMLGICRLENFILPKLPTYFSSLFGGSLFVVARKI